MESDHFRQLIIRTKELKRIMIDKMFCVDELALEVDCLKENAAQGAQPDALFNQEQVVAESHIMIDEILLRLAEARNLLKDIVEKTEDTYGQTTQYEEAKIILNVARDMLIKGENCDADEDVQAFLREKMNKKDEEGGEKEE